MNIKNKVGEAIALSDGHADAAGQTEYWLYAQRDIFWVRKGAKKNY
jgi:hypothetical protein